MCGGILRVISIPDGNIGIPRAGGTMGQGRGGEALGSRTFGPGIGHRSTSRRLEIPPDKAFFE